MRIIEIEIKNEIKLLTEDILNISEDIYKEKVNKNRIVAKLNDKQSLLVLQRIKLKLKKEELKSK